MNDRKPTYLVLGATGGIGTETSKCLLNNGANVFIASKTEDKLKSLSEEIEAPYKAINAINFSEVEECFQKAVDKFEQIDGVVNCVGSVLLKPAHLTNEQEWSDTLALNLTTAFATVRAAGKHMAKSGGSVVLISSAAAQQGIMNHEAIAAAKAGVIGLTLSAAATYSSKNLRFNAVAPGLVQTPMTEKITSSENARKASLALHSLGRLGEPKDIASLICWLLDTNNNWITGQVIAVDGGLSRVKK